MSFMTVGFGRSSSNVQRAPKVLLGALLVVAAVGACVQDLPPISGTTSLRVELTSPSDPGEFRETYILICVMRGDQLAKQLSRDGPLKEIRRFKVLKN